jgi:hypothetical protein
MNQACLTGIGNYTPYAWSCYNEGMEAAIITTIKPDMYGWQSIIPLYTTPQTHQLTDEEIKELHKGWTRWIDGGFELQVLQFARAIEAKVRGEK